MAWSRGRSWPGSQPGAHRKQTLPRGSAQYLRFSLHAVPFCAQEAVAPSLYSPFIRLSSRLQLHAHARHAWAFSIDRFGWSDPTSKRRVGRRFSGRYLISLENYDSPPSQGSDTVQVEPSTKVAANAL